MSKFNEAIGKRIRELRREQRYSRKEFAKLIGIKGNFLYEVETGRKGMSLENIHKLSQEFKVSIDYLVTGNHSCQKCTNIASFLHVYNESEKEDNNLKESELDEHALV